MLYFFKHYTKFILSKGCIYSSKMTGQLNCLTLGLLREANTPHKPSFEDTDAQFIAEPHSS